MKKKIKNNKKLFIVISIMFLATGGFLIYKNFKELSVNIPKKVEVNLNEEIYNTDNVLDLKNGKIITNKEKIDTSKVGTYEIVITIKNIFSKKKDYTYTLVVVDKEAPKIKYKKELETDYNKKIDLLKGVTATDNSGEKLEVTVNGKYNLTQAGTYTLYYVAKDSSGNETKEEFKLIVKEKNDSSNTNINEDITFTTSKGFNGYTKNGITYIDNVLIVNKTYSIPSTYTGGSSNKGLTVETYNAFIKMQSAATIDGIDLYIQSGYRSYGTQKKLYNNYVNRDGQKVADTYSARPGFSEHQTGLGFDVCSKNTSACISSNFNDTAPANWLNENAYKYGFILRYPKDKSDETGYKYESWHFRYVGVDLATKLYNDGDWITLENYFGITSQYK